MPEMRKRVTKYVTACSSCQISKEFNQRSYEKLQSISISQESLSEMSLDFIVELLMIIKKKQCTSDDNEPFLQVRQVDIRN